MIKNVIQSIALLSIFSFGVVVPVQAQATQNIAEIAIDTPTLSTLVSAATAADLVDTLSGTTELTVFAPTNDAFAALGSTLDVLLLPENKTLLSDIITYHAVAGEVDQATALTLSTATTVQGGTLALANNGGALQINGSVNVIQPDVDATNGIVHVIDGVLLSSELLERVESAVTAASADSSDDITVRSGGINQFSVIAATVVSLALVAFGVSTLVSKQQD